MQCPPPRHGEIIHTEGNPGTNPTSYSFLNVPSLSAIEDNDWQKLRTLIICNPGCESYGSETLWTVQLGRQAESIIEMHRLCRICTSHFWWVADFCRDTIRLWRVESRVHPSTLQQFHGHPRP
jgi:hypothetical protein